MPVVCLILAPITVGVLMGRRCYGAFVAAGIAARIQIIVVDVCFRYPALVRIRAICSCADMIVTGFAVSSPITVGVLMLRAEASIGADVAELILVVIIDVWRAVHRFAPRRAILCRADAIVPFGIIAPAIKGMRMAQFSGACIAAVVAECIRIIVVDVCGFGLDAAGFVRTVCIGALVPVAVYVPAPTTVDVAAGMVRSNGTLIAAKLTGGVRVIGIDMGSSVDDPACLFRAVRVGAFTPMFPAVPAPLAVEVGMGRGDGTIVAADTANAAVIGMAGLPGQGLAAGLGTVLPVFVTVIVPFTIGVLGVPVAAVVAVAVSVEIMRRVILARAGPVCADRVGTLAPMTGFIRSVEACGIGVVTEGALVAAGDTFRSGLTAVIMLGVFGNKFAIAIVDKALLPVMAPAGVPIVSEIVLKRRIAVAGLAPPILSLVSLCAAEGVIAAGCDCAAAGISAFFPVLVFVAEIRSEVMLAGDDADVAAGLTGGVVCAEAVGTEVLRDRTAVLRASMPMTAFAHGPDLLEAVLVVCHTAAAADAVFVIVMHRGHKDVELNLIAVFRVPDVMRLQRPQNTAVDGQVVPDVLLVGDKEGTARLGLQRKFSTVGLTAVDGSREDLVGDSAPAGVGSARVLAAQQPVGRVLRRCDHWSRLGAVGLSSFDDSPAFRGLDGHIEGADPAAVVTRCGDFRDIRLFVTAGAMMGLAACGLAGRFDLDGEVLFPVMTEGGTGYGFYMRGVTFTGSFYQAAFGTGGGDGFDFPIVPQHSGGFHLAVIAALPLAGTDDIARRITGSSVDCFQIMTQCGKFCLLLVNLTADPAVNL